MELSELLKWVNDLNFERGWDIIPVSMALVHLSEELGELAETMLSYESGDIDDSEVRYQVVGEAADSIILVVKLAQVCEVDLLTAMEEKSINELSTIGSKEFENSFDDLESHVIRILKSLGELARHVNFKEKYKNLEIRTNVQRNLEDELALMFRLLIIVGELCQVDIFEILRGKLEKISQRFSQEMARAETRHYLKHMASYSNELLYKFEERFRGSL